jgi:hypothetical protein
VTLLPRRVMPLPKPLLRPRRLLSNFPGY